MKKQPSKIIYENGFYPDIPEVPHNKEFYYEQKKLIKYSQKKKKHHISDIFKAKLKSKTWRKDLGLWETQYIIFRWITVYTYSIWKNGKFKNKYRLFEISPKTRSTIDKAIQLPEIVLGKKEFSERYNGNRFEVPMNIKYDETIE